MNDCSLEVFLFYPLFLAKAMRATGRDTPPKPDDFISTFARDVDIESQGLNLVIGVEILKFQTSGGRVSVG